MDWSIILWAIVIITFIVMVVVMIKGANSFVFVFDRFNMVRKIKAKEKDGKVSFKYNTSSKGGVAIENNVYKQGKKKVYFFRDVNGVLLPISDILITEKQHSFDLSTSQEKLFETEALKNVVNKIDNTWWAQIKAIATSALLIFGSMIVSIVMIQNAMEVEPIPEPQIEMWKDTNKAMTDLVESNQILIEEIKDQKFESQSQSEGGTPK